MLLDEIFDSGGVGKFTFGTTLRDEKPLHLGFSDPLLLNLGFTGLSIFLLACEP